MLSPHHFQAAHIGAKLIRITAHERSDLAIVQPQAHVNRIGVV